MHYCSGKEGELSQEEDYILSNPYHLVTLRIILISGLQAFNVDSTKY